MKRVISLPVLVVAFGYFVDIFDLTLFSMLRVSSLKSLGYSGQALIDYGILLLDAQMFGMLLGGVLWGMLGDKKGRLNVLFLSILLYSIGNILNAYVQNINQYVILRFISGIGLAGELGVGVTLVSELLPKEVRGLGTTLVAALGVLGAVFSGALLEYVNWRTAYLVGGFLGLTLLVFRLKIKESSLFTTAQKKVDKKNFGNFFKIFTNKSMFKRFFYTTLTGIPIWFIAGILMAFSPEIAKELGVTDPILASRTIMYSYLGLSIGDILSGILAQKLKSRKKSVQIFISITIVMIILQFLLVKGHGHLFYYFMAFLVGLGTGYWAVFVTMGAEQFGTNMRATVATSVPNFVRGSVIPITYCFKSLMPHIGILNSVIVVGITVFILGYIGSIKVVESFHRDLDYNEII